MHLYEQMDGRHADHYIPKPIGQGIKKNIKQALLDKSFTDLFKCTLRIGGYKFSVLKNLSARLGWIRYVN